MGWSLLGVGCRGVMGEVKLEVGERGERLWTRAGVL